MLNTATLNVHAHEVQHNNAIKTDELGKKHYN